MVEDKADNLIDRALDSGESNSVEFKETIPRQARDLAKEVAAFSTSGGGLILIGVTDEGEIVGFPDARERVEGVLQLVDPTPPARVQLHERAGKSLCVIFVEKGEDPPYYVENRPYLRDGSLSRPARPDEVKRLVQSSDSQTKESPEQEVNDAIRELEDRSYDIGGTSRSGREMLEAVGSQLLKGRDAFGFRADVAHAFDVTPSSRVDERPILQDWMLLGIVDTPQRIHPPQPSGPQSGTKRPEEPYDRYTVSALGKRVLRTLGRRKLDCQPAIIIDSDYGPEHGAAAYVVLRIVGEASNARGRLVSIAPTSDVAAISTMPSLQYPPGLLEWSSRYGGGEVATFASECELDVLAFENNDDAGTIVYLTESFRKNALLLDAAEAWKISIEVFAESGGRCNCQFRIRRGKSTVFAASSPRGTLYQPIIDDIRCS